MGVITEKELSVKEEIKKRPMSLENYFKDKDFCLEQMREARELFGNRKTTPEQYQAIYRVIGFVLLYGPEEIRYMAQALIDEVARREIFFITNVW
ncbi:MAG: hypothetical protein PVI88_00035 [Nitrosopumilaceae archaeon]|jgi:hypothetical protein